ncbi:MAG: hypothetical protein O3A61_06105 [Actinomycetota bacterium]|nr:hypothetical protein [Actinomycetota bacterium]MDA2995270.1 hypothetical protein [Actinomycetota bacterium]
MGQVLAILLAYVFIGVILTLPMQLIFGIDTESNLYAATALTWPVWGALLVVISWQILAMCSSKISSPISSYRTWSERVEATRKQEELRETVRQKGKCKGLSAN